MKFIGTISNPEDVITKQWIMENILSLIPTGSNPQARKTPMPKAQK